MIEIDITDQAGRTVASAQVCDPPFEMYYVIGDHTYKMEVRDRPKPEERTEDLNGEVP